MTLSTMFVLLFATTVIFKVNAAITPGITGRPTLASGATDFWSNGWWTNTWPTTLDLESCDGREIYRSYEYDSDYGTIQHPPNGGNYSNCENITWIIRAAYPLIYFLTFATEDGYDYLYIRDGNSSTSPLIGHFTGDVLPHPVQASSNAIFLQFTSDFSFVDTGFELQWGYTETCFYNGIIYQSGDILKIGCARFLCNGRTGNLSYGGYDYYNCRRCKAYLDPHIVTYDSYHVYRSSRSYSYQGCGNYSMTQFGNTYNPQVAVYATFTPCGGSSYLTCVDFVTFKSDEHACITLGYRDNMMIHQLNGEDFDISSTLPTPVQINSTVYPVRAWRTYRDYSKCVSLYGSSGILVTFCGSNLANQLFVWPDPNIQDQLQGLCGNITEIREDCFISRDGTKECPWTSYPNEEFGLSWLATGNSSCGNDDARFKRQSTQNRCEANSTVEDHFQSVCTSTASGNTNTDPGEVETLINDCVYDLCNVSDPDEWIKEVQETIKVLVLNEVNKPSECETSFKKGGWKGICIGNQSTLSNVDRCDSIVHGGNNGCDGTEACCVDCHKQTRLCNKQYNGSIGMDTLCNYCPNMLRVKTVRPGSGCVCCKECKPRRKCRRNGSRCITKNDPVYNPVWCLKIPGAIIKKRMCKHKGCWCCLVPPPT